MDTRNIFQFRKEKLLKKKPWLFRYRATNAWGRKFELAVKRSKVNLRSSFERP